LTPSAEFLAAADGVNGSRPSGVAEGPTPLAPDAFHGIVGDIVREIEPHTEADPAAVLAQELVMIGSAIGRVPHVRVEADRHGANLFALVVGRTGRSRKGTSRAQAQAPVALADPCWDERCVQTGLSSGEGLIHAVRDPATKIVEGEEVAADPGVGDKRLLVVEPEFAGPLRMLTRDGNTLSPVMRQAWDGGRLAVMTKNTPTRATDTHISVIGHITQEELLRDLSATDQANGFANRFLYFYASRSKELPEGGAAHLIDWKPIRCRLDAALRFARELDGPLGRDAEARELWTGAYKLLTAERPGMLGAITSRAEAQVTRLSLLYAVLDCSRTISVEHLRAALAVWDYSEASCRHIFGDQLGDPLADDLLRILRNAGSEGLTRTEISNRLGRHKSRHRIDRAFDVLARHGSAYCEQEPTGGRTSERWRAR
jgi:hypothetical protein